MVGTDCYRNIEVDIKRKGIAKPSFSSPEKHDHGNHFYLLDSEEESFCMDSSDEGTTEEEDQRLLRASPSEDRVPCLMKDKVGTRVLRRSPSDKEKEMERRKGLEPQNAKEETTTGAARRNEEIEGSDVMGKGGRSVNRERLEEQEGSQRGWISVSRRKCGGSAPATDKAPSGGRTTSPTRSERVSIPTPENGVCVHKINNIKMLSKKKPEVYNKDSMQMQAQSLNGGNDDQGMNWLENKVVQCGKDTGVTVDSTAWGWDGLIQFAKERDMQNKGELDTGMSKRKEGRELHGLNCSINYDKIRKQEEKRSRARNGVKDIRGTKNFLDEDFVMECKRSWGA